MKGKKGQTKMQHAVKTRARSRKTMKGAPGPTSKQNSLQDTNCRSGHKQKSTANLNR